MGPSKSPSAAASGSAEPDRASPDAAGDELLHDPTPDELGEVVGPAMQGVQGGGREPNVLCELCNGAYHLACLENVKLTAPACADDDEWFCRPCMKRGVPAILDRVGRDSSAHTWSVAWSAKLGRVGEHAAILDTAWSRKLIAQYVGQTEPS